MYKGAITFGLVYIPVTLSPAIKENDIGFNMLEKTTNSRVKYKKTCVDCDGREIGSDEIVKGFQYEKDKYVIFTDEDFEKIKSVKDKNITILSFANLDKIDPIYFDRAYYVVPTGGERAYALLAEALAKENKAGIAKTVLGTRETLLCLRARGGRLVANTLFFHNEVKIAPAIPEKAASAADGAELALAVNLINNMSGEFKPEQYEDEYYNKLKSAIEQKIAGQEIVTPRDEMPENVVNIMDALMKSVELTKKKNATKNVETPKKKAANK